MKCNLCQETRHRVVFKPDLASPVASESHYAATTDLYGHFGQIVQCLNCKLIYAHPRLSDQELTDLYRHQADDLYSDEDTSRSINALFCLNTILEFVQSGKLLEVGSAAGYFLNASRLHFDPCGIELCQSAADFSRKQLNLDVKSCRLQEACFADNTFEVVVMLDVIEHLPDPLQDLREIHRILRPGGLLYLVTPNINSFIARLLGSKWWGLRPAHLYYFSPDTLRTMLEKAGFQVARSKAYGRVFRMRYWLGRLKNYGPWVTRSMDWLMQRMGVANKLIYVNTMDSMEICACKNES